MRSIFALIALIACLMLSACNLQPMYASGPAGTTAHGLGAVEVGPIAGRAGWLMHNALNDRMSVAGTSDTRYRLDVRLDDQLEGLGVLNDDTISRERRTLRARYQLVDLDDGKILLDRTAESDAGIDVVSSEYATIAAEQRALENLAQGLAGQIVTQVALQLRKQPEGK